jgi:hypothetical protein
MPRPRSSLARRWGLALALLALGAGVGGCSGAGVSKGATVSVYVETPLCPGAERELSRAGDDASDVHIHAICLPTPRHGTRLDLAAVGANARRASEDSTTIAYLAAPSAAFHFSHPILESAGIATVKASSGATAMRKLLHVVSEADSSSLRDSVREALE